MLDAKLAKAIDKYSIGIYTEFPVIETRLQNAAEAIKADTDDVLYLSEYEVVDSQNSGNGHVIVTGEIDALNKRVSAPLKEDATSEDVERVVRKVVLALKEYEDTRA